MQKSERRQARAWRFLRAAPPLASRCKNRITPFSPRYSIRTILKKRLIVLVYPVITSRPRLPPKRFFCRFFHISLDGAPFPHSSFSIRMKSTKTLFVPNFSDFRAFPPFSPENGVFCHIFHLFLPFRPRRTRPATVRYHNPSRVSLRL